MFKKYMNIRGERKPRLSWLPEVKKDSLADRRLNSEDDEREIGILN